jgi:hypothetical protein
MRIKIKANDVGYIVVWKRYFFQPWAYYVLSNTCHPTWTMDVNDLSPTQEQAVRKALNYFASLLSGKLKTIAVLKSIEELEALL